MSIEIITKEDLREFRVQLMNDLKKVFYQQQPSPEKNWLKSVEVRKLLKISPNTLQSLRMRGKLNPAKVGGILYYKLEEINTMLNQSIDNKSIK